MKKSVLIALVGIMYVTGLHSQTLVTSNGISFVITREIVPVDGMSSQTSVLTGTAQLITDTSAHFQPFVYNNMDTTMTSTIWVKFLSPVIDSVAATLVLPRNFSFNFDYQSFICSTTQTYVAAFRNNDTTVYGSVQSFTLLPCTGIAEHSIPSSMIAITPMPVTESSVLSIDGQHDGTIVIYDALGKQVNQLRLENGQAVLKREDFAPGMYFCIGYDGNGMPIGSQKFIVQ